MCTANPEKSRMIYATNTILLSCLKPPPYRTIHLEGLRRNAPFRSVISVGCARSPIIGSDPPQPSSITIRPCHTSCYINAHGRSPSGSVPCSLAWRLSAWLLQAAWHSPPTGVSRYWLLLSADGVSLQDTFTQFWVPEQIISFQIRIELYWSIYVLNSRRNSVP